MKNLYNISSPEKRQERKDSLGRKRVANSQKSKNMVLHKIIAS